MADVYEQNLAQKSTLTTSDFIRVVGSDNVSYKQNMISVMETMGLGTAINNGTDLNTLVLPANDKKIKVYRGENLSQMTNKPSGVTSAWPFCLMLLPIGGAYTKQILHIYGTDATPDYVYVRTQTYLAGGVVWTDWQQSPTRAEVDALNSKTTTNANALMLEAKSLYPVVDGNKCNKNVAYGEYVYVRNSTIASISDGLHWAYKAITANTVIDSSYLVVAKEAATINALNSKTTGTITNINPESVLTLVGGGLGSYAEKYGQVVHFISMVKFTDPNSALENGTVVFRLPSGLRPSRISLIEARQFSRMGGTVGYGYIKTDGEVYLSQGGIEANAGNIVFEALYLSA